VTSNLDYFNGVLLFDVPISIPL